MVDRVQILLGGWCIRLCKYIQVHTVQCAQSRCYNSATECLHDFVIMQTNTPTHPHTKYVVYIYHTVHVSTASITHLSTRVSCYQGILFNLGKPLAI